VSVARAVRVVGVVERDGGTLYCTVLFIHPTLGLVGKHRKLMPTGSERVIWGQGDGTTLPVLEASFPSLEKNDEALKVKIAAAICW